MGHSTIQADERAIAIKNRDIPILSRVLYAMQDARAMEKQIDWQRDRLSNIIVNMSGMPKSGGLAAGFDAIYAEIDALCETYRERLSLYMRELAEAERILNGIRHPKMRTFVVMLYVEQIPHTTVRRELDMTEYAFQKARHAIEQAKSMREVVWRERYIVEN